MLLGILWFWSQLEALILLHICTLDYLVCYSPQTFILLRRNCECNCILYYGFLVTLFLIFVECYLVETIFFDANDVKLFEFI